MLNIDDCCLVVVDVQEKLAAVMDCGDQLFENLSILVESAKILGLPIINCRQYPKALGQTIEPIADMLSDTDPIDKMVFSCCGSDEFNDRLSSIDRQSVMLCGIETHVCVYQTAMDLLRMSHIVHLVTDATSSRTAANKTVAISRMQTEGVKLTSTEMVLFGLLKTADHKNFKQIAKLIK